jgi:(p)ppGpp synthase/HD superfamily hydrolase
MSELRIAERIAREAHTGQTEKSTGDPYIRHVERVVDLVQGDQQRAVAWLHDVLEDSAFSDVDLSQAGISGDVVEAVLLLTHDKTQATYQQYIERIRASGSPLAIAVKLADLRDHLRPNCPGRLVERYQHALRLLEPLEIADVAESPGLEPRTV